MRVQRGFRAFEIRGALDFSLSGVLSRHLAPLAAAQIPVFVISTFDTDYILVRARHIEQAVEVLAPHCRVEQPEQTEVGTGTSRAHAGRQDPQREVQPPGVR